MKENKDKWKGKGTTPVISSVEIIDYQKKLNTEWREEKREKGIMKIHTRS